MKAIKTLSLFLWIICMMPFFASCGDDEDDSKEIYGTFVGSAQGELVSLPTSEIIDDFTSSARLSLVKEGENMVLNMVFSDKGRVTVSNLPVVDVVGSSEYSYEYTSEDGSLIVKIKSPDYDAVNVTISKSDQEDNTAIHYTFNGKRK